MAQAGLGSRRACEQIILDGRVTVNGRPAGLGEKADLDRDRVLVDGAPLRLADKPMYVAIYKPRGVLSTVSAPDPRPTVRDQVDLPGYLYPVGRLDVDSEGLVLLTNDGDLANRLTHPRYEHEKEYRVLVAARPDEEQLATWRRGVVLDDGYKTQPAEVRVEQPFGKGAWLRVILKEGRKRQIRETGSKLGLPVVKIIRVRIGSLTLGSLQPGQWRVLSASEIERLKQPAGSDSRPGGRGRRVRQLLPKFRRGRSDTARSAGAAWRSGDEPAGGRNQPSGGVKSAGGKEGRAISGRQQGSSTAASKLPRRQREEADAAAHRPGRRSAGGSQPVGVRKPGPHPYGSAVPRSKTRPSGAARQKPGSVKSRKPPAPKKRSHR